MKINKKNILKNWSEIQNTLGQIIKKVELSDTDEINGKEIQKLLTDSQLPLHRLFNEFKYDNVWKKCDRLKEEMSLLRKEAKEFSLDELTMRNLRRANVFIDNTKQEIRKILKNKLFFEFYNLEYIDGVYEVDIRFNTFGWLDRFSCYGADDAPFFSPFSSYGFSNYDKEGKEKREMVERSFKERGYHYCGCGIVHTENFVDIFENEINKTFKDLFRKIYFGNYEIHAVGGICYLEKVKIKFAQK